MWSRAGELLTLVRSSPTLVGKRPRAEVVVQPGGSISLGAIHVQGLRLTSLDVEPLQEVSRVR